MGLPHLVFKRKQWVRALSWRVCGQPVLLTTQLMYPGSFILHAAVNSWLAGDDIDAIHVSAGKSYAKNQKLSVKAGMGVFAKLTESSLELKIKK